MKMTEHTDKVELQKEKILKESLDQQVTAIDIRFGRIQTRYAIWQSSYRIPQGQTQENH
jgi:hypothetical protein